PGRRGAGAREMMTATRPDRAFATSLVLAAGLLLAALGGCDLAPFYAPPKYVLPDAWRGQGMFTRAMPGDTLPRGPWWELFGDPVLTGLEQQLAAQNPTLAAMYEQYVQARDNAAIARSGLYPQLNVSGQLSYEKRSQNEPFIQNAQITTATNNIVQAGATWQTDFWDRIRNGERLQARLAQSQAAQVANARLSLEGQLASAYVALRGYDVLAVNYRAAVANYETSVKVTKLRLQGAIAAGLDVARAEAQLASTLALQSANAVSRTIVEHSIAVLVGANPSTFSIPPQERWTLVNPAPPPMGVPSQLLERRPDIASAERQMAAANAGIGITRAAFYPTLTISPTAGFQDTGFALASIPNSLWSVGATTFLPLFEGGLRRAELQQSWSQFAQTRDTYRAIVLAAFQQVEDELALYASLQGQDVAQAASVAASNRAQSLTEQLYVGGLITYVEVVVAQETALLAQISATQTRTAQLQATANLLVAVGGGWSSAELPTQKGLLPFEPLDVLHFNREPTPDGTGLENAAGPNEAP
ncbi:MAG: efflux transporter outer membrane subunit, partial [Janthinobacterium lividum]